MVNALLFNKTHVSSTFTEKHKQPLTKKQKQFFSKKPYGSEPRQEEANRGLKRRHSYYDRH